MVQASAGWQEGQQVHRPFGFLVGEKLDGSIQSIRLSHSGATAQVVWADGDISQELLEDLATGARPAVQKNSWWRRLLSSCQR